MRLEPLDFGGSFADVEVQSAGSSDEVDGPAGHLVGACGGVSKVPRNSNLLVLSFRLNGLQNHDYSPYDKDGKRDEEDHTEPIHLLMERLYE